jgi:hypothetical protein
MIFDSFFLKDNKPEVDKETFWREATIIDPKALKSKTIIKESTNEIKNVFKQRFKDNFAVVHQYGADICERNQARVCGIINPVKLEWKKRRQAAIRKVRDFLFFIITLDIPRSLILDFPTKAYQHPCSMEFLETAKLGKRDKLSDMILKISNLLVYEFDHFKQTALHWACNRDFRGCAEALIEAKSYTNGCDIYGRTPLFYAIRNQNVVIVYLLLINLSSPWSPNHTNYIKLANKHEQIIYYIRKFRMMDLMRQFQKPANRAAFRQNYLKIHIKNPF